MKAAHPASAGAVVVGLGVTARTLVGDHTLLGVPGLALPGATVLFVGAMAAAASVHRRGRRLPAWLITASLGLVAASSLVGSCFLLLNLIALAVTGSVTDRAGNSDWATFGERLGAVVLAALFTVATRSWRRNVSARCSRCGRSHPSGPATVVRPAPHAASRTVQWTAFAGCAAFVSYLVIHGLGMAGFIPENAHHYADSDQPWPLVFAAFVLGLVGPAVLLLLGLVRPWGMAFPRWTVWLAGRRVPRLLPLIPVWLVAPTLALYGLGSVVYAIAGGHDVWSLGGAASLAFGGYGCALAIAAVSYERRTRPQCALVAN